MEVGCVKKNLFIKDEWKLHSFEIILAKLTQLMVEWFGIAINSEQLYINCCCCCCCIY